MFDFFFYHTTHKEGLQYIIWHFSCSMSLNLQYWYGRKTEREDLYSGNKRHASGSFLQHTQPNTKEIMKRVHPQSNKEKHNKKQESISLESYYYAGDIVCALPNQCLFSKVLCCSPGILYVLDWVCCFLVCHYLDFSPCQLHYIGKEDEWHPTSTLSKYCSTTRLLRHKYTTICKRYSLL